MARKATTFIPDVKGTQHIPLADIPEDVKAFVEDTLKQQTSTGGRTRVEYDSADELATEFRQMVSYAAQRPEGLLKIRKSPTRDLADNVMDVRIVHDVAANGAKEGARNSRRNS